MPAELVVVSALQSVLPVDTGKVLTYTEEGYQIHLVGKWVMLKGMILFMQLSIGFVFRLNCFCGHSVYVQYFELSSVL